MMESSDLHALYSRWVPRIITETYLYFTKNRSVCCWFITEREHCKTKFKCILRFSIMPELMSRISVSWQRFVFFFLLFLVHHFVMFVPGKVSSKHHCEFRIKEWNWKEQGQICRKLEFTAARHCFVPQWAFLWHGHHRYYDNPRVYQIRTENHGRALLNRWVPLFFLDEKM